ncbi:hypothetical protein AZH53_04115 [Methanomicrobiaceae archaeon CYW5]|uniref:hypothetical protein n=1 Tax=Methanovulcanius yangii TaxID=1789227 RepID=UPI0029CA6C94|nr:hypothetical protein [Methanovulcanius yangii]MBT8507604.1 hypothetical protein [Methanovulcanius yangii]
MNKLFAALLVAALCMVAPAIAMEWDDLPAEAMVYIDSNYPPGDVMGTYFDVYFCDKVCGARCVDCCDWEPVGDPYAGWCVDTSASSIKDVCYCGEMYSTIGVSPELNQVNWILNNKHDLSYGEIQAAIWMVMNQPNTKYPDWDTALAERLANAADPEFEPGCGDIVAIWILPCDDDGQGIIIEMEIPPCPPVPEFPVMTIPLFFVGGVLVAASVLRKE